VDVWSLTFLCICFDFAELSSLTLRVCLGSVRVGLSNERLQHWQSEMCWRVLEL
jgi:hypothetical protein